MPYCKNCGIRLPERAEYCPNCGSRVAAVPRPVLASWGERFVAWLIDIIILGIILVRIKLFVAWTMWPWDPWIPRFMRWVPFIDLGPGSIVYFLYWTFMEGLFGQSVSKMIMKIKVTRPDSKPPDITQQP